MNLQKYSLIILVISIMLYLLVITITFPPVDSLDIQQNYFTSNSNFTDGSELLMPNYSSYQLTFETNFTGNLAVTLIGLNQSVTIFNDTFGISETSLNQKFITNSSFTIEPIFKTIDTKPWRQFKIQVEFTYVSPDSVQNSTLPPLLAYFRTQYSLISERQDWINQNVQFLLILLFPLTLAVFPIFLEKRNSETGKASQLLIADRMVDSPPSSLGLLSYLTHSQTPHPIYLVSMVLFYLSLASFWRYDFETYLNPAYIKFLITNSPNGKIIYFLLTATVTLGCIDMSPENLKIFWSYPISRSQYLGAQILKYLSVMTVININVASIFILYQENVIYSIPMSWTTFLLLVLQLEVISLFNMILVICCILISNNRIQGLVVSFGIIVLLAIYKVSWYNISLMELFGTMATKMLFLLILSSILCGVSFKQIRNYEVY